MQYLVFCNKHIYHLNIYFWKTLWDRNDTTNQNLLWHEIMCYKIDFNFQTSFFFVCWNSRNVIKSFYTASLLYDTLVEFGELSQEATQRQKYSKWKATYINKCLKEGTTPISGPPGGEVDEFGDDFGEPSTSHQPPSSGGGTAPYPTDPYNTGQPSSYTPPPSQPPSYHQVEYIL